MVPTKSQIRRRQEQFRFSNADLLGLDTVGLVQLVSAAPLGFVLRITDVWFRANIAVDYGTIDADAFFSLVDDFNGTNAVENNATSGDAVSQLLAPGFPAVSLNGIGTNVGLRIDSGPYPVPQFGFSWTGYAQIAALGGIFLVFDNGGTDLTGGDAANYLDVIVEYNIVNG